MQLKDVFIGPIIIYLNFRLSVVSATAASLFSDHVHWKITAYQPHW